MNWRSHGFSHCLPFLTPKARAEVRAEAEAFLKLAIPLTTAQIAQFAVGFVDTIMMGRLGTEALAAGGLASTTFQMLLAVIGGFVMSVGVLAAEALGAGEKARVTGLVRQGLNLCFLLAVPFMGLLVYMSPVLRILQQPETVVGLAQQYFSAIATGILPALGFVMLRGYFSAFSLAKVVTGVVAIGTVFNIGCNYVLGFGKLGFPPLGLTGLGLGSGLSFWLMFALFLGYILWHPQLSQYRFWGWQFSRSPKVRFAKVWDLKILRQLLAMGAPMAGVLLIEYGLFSAMTYMAGSLGTTVLAAHQVAFQIMALVFMVPLGMSYAVTARVGMWLGKKDRAGQRRAGTVAMGSALGFLSMSAGVLYFVRRPAIGLFVDLQDPQNGAVIALAMTLLLVSMVAQTIDGVQKLAVGALHGLQDKRTPMWVSLFTYWGVGLTTGYGLCFLQGWGAIGLWIGQYVGVTVGGVIFVMRFYRLTSGRAGNERKANG